MALSVQLRFARALRYLAFRVLLALVVLILAIGTLFYWCIEGWSALDTFYLSSILLITVGYGDLTPSTLASKLFTVFYIITGVGIIVALVNAVARH